MCYGRLLTGRSDVTIVVSLALTCGSDVTLALTGRTDISAAPTGGSRLKPRTVLISAVRCYHRGVVRPRGSDVSAVSCSNTVTLTGGSDPMLTAR